MSKSTEQKTDGELADVFYAGFTNLPASVKQRLSMHQLREVFTHMVKPVIAALPPVSRDAFEYPESGPLRAALEQVREALYATCVLTDKQPHIYDRCYSALQTLDNLLQGQCHQALK